MADNDDLSAEAEATTEALDAEPKLAFLEIGSTGLRQTGGQVIEEFLPQLAGSRATGVYREMGDNDPVVGGLLFAIDKMMRQVDWQVEPAVIPEYEEALAKARAQVAEDQKRRDLEAQMAMAQAAPPPGGPGGGGPPPGGPQPAGGPNQPEPFTKAVPADPLADPATEPDPPESRDAAAFDPSVAAAPSDALPPDDGPAVEDLIPPELKAKAKAAAEVADFVESCLHDMSAGWEDTLSSILSMVQYGWSYHEIVYKVRVGPDQEDPRLRSAHTDKKIGWRKFAYRAQHTLLRWEFAADGDVAGLWQQDPHHRPFNSIFLPIRKSLLFRTESASGNPQGKSILRNAYRPWYYKKRLEEIEAIGVERDLAGLPMAMVPPQLLSPNATTEEQAALEEIKTIVRNVKRNEQEGVVFPAAYDPNGNLLYDFKLLSTGGRRQFDTDTIISRYDQRIAMVALADFILLGHENVGSFALGSSKINLFSAALGAWLDMVADTVNKHAIPRLLDLNGIDAELTPTLTHADVEEADLASLGQFVAHLAGSGAELFPDDDVENRLREIANLPAKQGANPI